MVSKKQTFLLVSLEEEQAKKLARIVGSDTCKKILAYLSSHDSSTETEISRELAIPLPTVHYNLKQLLEAGMVQTEEFHYSEKGKEVNHYSLANKYIIIAPKKTEALSAKLRRILPAALVITLTAGLAKLVTKNFFVPQPTIITKTYTEAAVATERAVVADIVPQTMLTRPDLVLWFFYGAMFALFVFLVIDLIIERLKR